MGARPSRSPRLASRQAQPTGNQGDEHLDHQARAEADLPKLETLFGPELAPLAKLMDLCPEDPIKSAVYQTVATVMLQAELGVGAGAKGDGDGEGKGGGDPKKVGPRIMTSADPSKKLAHGHQAGTKRDSRAEKDSAAAGKVH